MNIRNYRAWLALCVALPAASHATGVNFFDPTDTAAVPKTLTQAGIYTDINAKITDTALKYYEVNAALWSDGAAKKRWAVLPPGTHINYVDSLDNFDYPNHTIFVKNFYLDSVLNDSTTRKYWETRLLVNKEDGDGNDYWYGFSYKWNAGATQATYVGAEGLDSVFYYYPKGLGQPSTYKKWTFPSKGACLQCHRVGSSDGITARSVLGFYPAQLKRPSSSNPAVNQVTALFTAGVFTGSVPNSTQLARRFKGLTEAIPGGLTAAQRFAVIDTMARSYIAANCSGCHSARNIYVSGSAPVDLNYDFFTLKPAIEFGSPTVNALGLDNPDEDTSSLNDGRHKFILSVRNAGVPMTLGTPWDMAFAPEGIPSTLIVPGFPASSPALYRQFAARLTPWRDSLQAYTDLQTSDPQGWKTWLFVHPWGSQAWKADLAAHSVSVNSVVTYGSDGSQMPLLGSYIPDTSAMRVLGEWAKTYRTLNPVDGQPIIASIKHLRAASEGPRVQSRLLIVPADWSGRAEMLNISGRAYTLPSAGRGQYVIPAAIPSGLYFFKVGNHSFRASVLR